MAAVVSLAKRAAALRQYMIDKRQRHRA